MAETNNDFKIDVGSIKDRVSKIEAKVEDLRFAGKESDICHTIEELLELNKLIPARKNEILGLTESQLEKTDNRGEVEEVIERQFEDRQADKDLGAGILEYRLNNDTGSEYKQRRPVDSEDNIPPIWQEVYKNEEERKKLDTGQLNKKLASKEDQSHLVRPQSIDFEKLASKIKSEQ